MNVLCILLGFAYEHAETSMRTLKNELKNGGIRIQPEISTAECIVSAEYFEARTKTFARLHAWAALYAAREKAGHPGWEGLRIACELDSKDAVQER
jgi:hypothetical protein